jgi:hypothetical protein
MQLTSEMSVYQVVVTERSSECAMRESRNASAELAVVVTELSNSIRSVAPSRAKSAATTETSWAGSAGLEEPGWQLRNESARANAI